jgi:hypothetical protein
LTVASADVADSGLLFPIVAYHARLYAGNTVIITNFPIILNRPTTKISSPEEFDLY